MTSSIDSKWPPQHLFLANDSSAWKIGARSSKMRRPYLPNRLNHPVPPPSERPDKELLRSASASRPKVKLLRYETLVTSGRLYSRVPVANDVTVNKQLERNSGGRIERERAWKSLRSTGLNENSILNDDEKSEPGVCLEPVLPSTLPQSRDVVVGEPKNVDFNENIVSMSNLSVDNHPARMVDQAPPGERSGRVVRLQWCDGGDGTASTRGNRSRMPTTIRHLSATAAATRHSRSAHRSVSGNVLRDQMSGRVGSAGNWPSQTEAWRQNETASSGTAVTSFFRGATSGRAFPFIESLEKLRKASHRRMMNVLEQPGVVEAAASATTLTHSSALSKSHITAVPLQHSTTPSTISKLVIVGRTLKASQSERLLYLPPSNRSSRQVESSTLKRIDVPLAVGQLLGVVSGRRERGQVKPSNIAELNNTQPLTSAAGPADDVAQMIPDDDDDVTTFSAMTSSAVHRVDVRFTADVNKTPNGVANKHSPLTNGKTWHTATNGGSASWSPRRSHQGSSVRHPDAQSPTTNTNGSRTLISGKINPSDSTRRLDYRVNSPPSNVVQSSLVQQSSQETDDHHSSPLRQQPLNSSTTDTVSLHDVISDAEQHNRLPVVGSVSSSLTSESPTSRDVVLASAADDTVAVALAESASSRSDASRLEYVTSSDDVEKVTSNDGTVTGDGTCIPASSKDGEHFLVVVEQEERRIDSLCSTVESDMHDTGIPDEAAGKIRSAIGKAHLLTTKKFNQFRELCRKNLTQDADEPFPTTCQDLEGFWDLVMIQVDDVIGLFAEIDSLKKNNWARPEPIDNSPASPSWRLKNGTSDSSAGKPTVVKSRSASRRSDATPSPQSSSKSDSAAKSREEARKRLLAAKAAGRQRKASVETESDEVQIFVS